MAGELTYKEYVAQVKRDLAAFKMFWSRGRKKDPEHFPERMARGEWEEQFMLFDTEVEKDEPIRKDSECPSP